MRPEVPLSVVATDYANMSAQAFEATAFLKALSHEGRLLILCHLANGEKTVGELESLLGARQAAVSQQLARLRLESFVSSRREGKTIYYRLCDGRVRDVLDTLDKLFAADPSSEESSGGIC